MGRDLSDNDFSARWFSNGGACFMTVDWTGELTPLVLDEPGSASGVSRQSAPVFDDALRGFYGESDFGGIEKCVMA